MQRAAQAEDIRKEPLIRKKWEFKKIPSSSYADGILVTGANSFIGTHVISRLQSQWKGTVHLLLRAATEREAVNKMKRAFRQWEPGTFQSEAFSIHLGDVTREMMGLEPKEYAALKQNVGFVLHLAMNPLYNLPYVHFRRLWIPELERMIAFCGDQSYPKALHYPLPLNAHLFNDKKNYHQLNRNAWLSGYAGFKWVAARAIENAFNQNLNGCLYEIPLVLGSQEKGLCPTHYALWHIMDIFLKTGMYTDFAFRIIPVDVLAGVIVANLMADKKGKAHRFLRPVLAETVTHRQFGNMAANMLGLKHATPGKLRAGWNDTRKFDFLFPGDFNALQEKINRLPAVWPEGFQVNNSLSASLIFIGNLNRMLLHSKNVKDSIYV